MHPALTTTGGFSGKRNRSPCSSTKQSAKLAGHVFGSLPTVETAVPVNRDPLDFNPGGPDETRTLTPEPINSTLPQGQYQVKMIVTLSRVNDEGHAGQTLQVRNWTNPFVVQPDSETPLVTIQPTEAGL